MKVIRSVAAMQAEAARLRRRGRTLGFVPTMGALHAGHLSLVAAARRENDVVVVSVFVNPTQFGPKEDYRRYPRTWTADRKKLARAGTDICFYPTVKQMYPGGLKSAAASRWNGALRSLASGLCGKSRPGHFRGVCTVVRKLLDAVRPHRVYFGAKDYQQAVIVRRMIRDLGLGTRFRLCPIVREKDGLALSSRNRYLSPRDRARARALSAALRRLKREIAGGRRDLAVLRLEARRRLAREVDRVDYLEIVDPVTLKRVTRFQKRLVAAAACFLGKTRLIDNVIINT